MNRRLISRLATYDFAATTYNRTVYVVLPAYDEEKNIPSLVTRLSELSQIVKDIQPILVDDGSSDDTAEVGRALGRHIGMQIIQHGINKGLGAAVLTGMKTVCQTASDGDVLVLLDADNSHDPNRIAGMLELMDKGYDVVIASRYVPGGKEIGLSSVRRAGSRLVSLALATVFRVEGASDYTCGFRAYRVGAIRKGFAQYGDGLISESSFVCMAELLVKLHSIGARISEYPLILRYDLKQGKSKMRYVHTLGRYFHFIRSQSQTINTVHMQNRRK